MGKKNNDRQSYILTKETIGMTIMLFSAIVTIILLTGSYVFGAMGAAICTFMYGTFGYASYIVMALIAYGGELLTFEKKLKVNSRPVIFVALAALCLFLLFHSVSTRDYSLEGYGAYLAECYSRAAEGFSGYSFGGAVCGIIVYPIAKLMTFIAAYVIFSILSLLTIYVAYVAIRSVRADAVNLAPSDVVQNNEGEAGSEDIQNLPPVDGGNDIVEEKVRTEITPLADSSNKSETLTRQDSSEKYSRENLGKRILFEPGEFAAESYRRNMIYNENSYFNHPVRNEGDYLKSFSSGTSDKQSQPTMSSGTDVPPKDTTYTRNFSQNTDLAADSHGMPRYIYGDSPVSDLNIARPSEEQTTYNSYSAVCSPDATVGDEITHEDEEVSVIREEPEQYKVYEDIQHNSDIREDSAPNAGQQLNESETGVQQQRSQAADNYGQSSVASSDMRADINVLRGGMNGVVPSDGNSDAEKSFPAGDTSSSASEQPYSEMPARGERNGLFNLFSSSNPRLAGERRIEPDVSALSGRDRVRDSGRENLFDDENGSSLYGGGDILSSVGGIGGGSRRENVLPAANPDVRSTNLRDGETHASQSRGVGVSSGQESVNSGRIDAQAVPTHSVPVAEETEKAQTAEMKPEQKPRHIWKKYVRPTLDLLKDYPENTNVNTAEIEESKKTIVDTLASFHIESEVANVVVGPAITRYDIIIKDKTNIKNAIKYRESVAMSLMKENVNAYLNYSKGALSFEIPNSSRSVVGLKTILASSQFINVKPNSLCFAFGKNVEGKVVCPDITKMPHLLVAGTTGSGKSIMLSSLIVSLLYKYGPEELRFILVDPKQVEFISYDKLPHLMINEIIYDVDKAIKALNWAIKEMERRYQLFKEMTEKGLATKSLTEYNANLGDDEEKLPKIVIILDEFGDLMMQAKKDIESRIIRLVQKARACGIHLILATQRPSVDCITGLIKSNLPTRIGFKVNSFDDSRCIFDIGGAEKLLGKGDCYFRTMDSPELVRIQGCFIDSMEVQRVTDFVKQNNETYFDQSVSDFINTVEEPQDSGSSDSSNNSETKIDDTFIKALKFCVTNNQASVSMIQRRFPIGYMKACKIIDWMENMNYVTQSEGAKPRKVLLSKEEFIKTYGDLDD